MGMQTPSLMGDTFGVPTFFVDTAIPEDAGNGIVRVWNCQNRNGILVPQCEIIIHSARLVVAGKLVSEYGVRAFNAEQMQLEMSRH